MDVWWVSNINVCICFGFHACIIKADLIYEVEVGHKTQVVKNKTNGQKGCFQEEI